jgi:hypothetical protein
MLSEQPGHVVAPRGLRANASGAALLRFYGFGLLLALIVYLQLYYAWQKGISAPDFRQTLWDPGRDILHWRSPYPAPDSVSLQGAEAVYPPLAMLIALPLGLIPFVAAKIVWQAILIAAAFATLAAIGVRDPRCYGIWLLSAPVVLGVVWGNATLLVIACAAFAWRWRDRTWLVAAALTLGVLLKLFLAPLWLWLLFTGRRTAALATALAIPLTLLSSWALIGFSGLRDYPELLSTLARHHVGRGVLAQAFVVQSGGGRALATAIGLIAATLCVAVAWRLRGDDLSVFAAACVAALLVTPIAWIYYPGLLVVPLAVRWPKLSWAWAYVAALWVGASYSPLDFATAELSGAVLALVAVALAAILLAGRRTTVAQDFAEGHPS